MTSSGPPSFLFPPTVPLSFPPQRLREELQRLQLQRFHSVDLVCCGGFKKALSIFLIYNFQFLLCVLNCVLSQTFSPSSVHLECVCFKKNAFILLPWSLVFSEPIFLFGMLSAQNVLFPEPEHHPFPGVRRAFRCFLLSHPNQWTIFFRRGPRENECICASCCPWICHPVCIGVVGVRCVRLPVASARRPSAARPPPECPLCHRNAPPPPPTVSQPRGAQPRNFLGLRWPLLCNSRTDARNGPPRTHAVPGVGEGGRSSDVVVGVEGRVNGLPWSSGAAPAHALQSSQDGSSTSSHRGSFLSASLKNHAAQLPNGRVPFGRGDINPCFVLFSSAFFSYPAILNCAWK